MSCGYETTERHHRRARRQRRPAQTCMRDKVRAQGIGSVARDSRPPVAPGAAATKAAGLTRGDNRPAACSPPKDMYN